MLAASMATFIYYLYNLPISFFLEIVCFSIWIFFFTSVRHLLLQALSQHYLNRYARFVNNYNFCLTAFIYNIESLMTSRI